MKRATQNGSEGADKTETKGSVSFTALETPRRVENAKIQWDHPSGTHGDYRGDHYSSGFVHCHHHMHHLPNQE
jgi:hypothetical protein